MYIVEIIHILIKTLYINSNKNISIFIILNLFKIGNICLQKKKPNILQTLKLILFSI